MKPLHILTVTTLLMGPVFMLSGCHRGPGWESTLLRQTPLLGHRNWIVVADSAYPLQTAAGITTIYSGRDHITVVEKVLDAVDHADHVQPVIYLDRELSYVPPQYAPGIDALREDLSRALAAYEPVVLPHEQIIAKLDEVGQTFGVLLIKTDLTLPYTSVFIELEAGYWSPEAEQALRRAMAGDAR